MGIGFIIKDLADKKNLSAVDLARLLGKSRQAIYDLMEKDDVSTAIVRQCSEIFDVPPSYFFQEGGAQAVAKDHSIAAINSTVTPAESSCQEKITLLEKLVEEKERTIQILLNKQ